MRSWRMRRPPKRWSLHTKLTLTTTFCIVIASFTWFLLMEWNNKLLFAYIAFIAIANNSISTKYRVFPFV